MGNQSGRKGKTEATEEATGHRRSWREAETGRSGTEKRENEVAGVWKLKRLKGSNAEETEAGQKGTKETGRKASTCGTAVGAKQGRAK